MSKIKEIRKIESPIKEIKKEKVESLDDEVEEDNADYFVDSSGFRRFGKSSTIEASEGPQDQVAVRERRVSKEDEQEISFRPSYTGGSQNTGNAYTPVGAAESSGISQTRVLGEERPLEQNRLGQPPNLNDNSQTGGERAGERAYIQDNIRDEEQKRDRRRNMM